MPRVYYLLENKQRQVLCMQMTESDNGMTRKQNEMPLDAVFIEAYARKATGRPTGVPNLASDLMHTSIEQFSFECSAFSSVERCLHRPAGATCLCDTHYMKQAARLFVVSRCHDWLKEILRIGRDSARNQSRASAIRLKACLRGLIVFAMRVQNTTTQSQ